MNHCSVQTSISPVIMANPIDIFIAIFIVIAMTSSTIHSPFGSR